MRKDERNEKTTGDNKREQMERGWTKRGNKEVKKTLWKGSMLRRRSRKIKQKTTWKTDERKTENKKRPKNTKHEVFPTESVLKKVKSSKRKVKKRGRTNYHFAIFLEKKKKRRKRKHKGTFLFF